MEGFRYHYVPVDFIKAQVNGMSPSDFENNTLLESTRIVDDDEIVKTIYRYKNLRVTVYTNNDRIELSGSLHSFYNGGFHNHNDFNKSNFKWSVDEVYDKLNILPENLRILQLEWGYNIEPPVFASQVIDSLVQHKSVNKTVGIDNKNDGHYVQFVHSNYILKIYNKGLHFKLKKDLLRLEVKQTNWSEFRQQGFITLKDYMEGDNTLFFDTLIRHWGNVILYDIRKESKKNDYKYHTNTFWDDRRQNYSYKNFKHHSDKLRHLNHVEGYNTQEKIKSILKDKGKELQL